MNLTRSKPFIVPPPPPAKSFVGRVGLLEARECPGGWVWRFAGLGRWRGDAESLPEALNQAAESCGLAMFEARWREVGGEAANENLVESTTWRAFAGSYAI
jgi:hypothetical protein